MVETVLSTWNETATRAAIEAFVQAVTTSGPGFVPAEQRVAVFDNDGTLWCEKPLQIQLDFVLRRLAELAAHDATLRRRQPWKAAFDSDLGWLGSAVTKHYDGDDGDLMLLMDAVPKAFADLTVEEYSERVLAFFRASDHPTLGRPYLSCGYRPMVELIRYLEAHGFTSYIASGGDRDFMRPVASTLYNIPPERVIGSSQALAYRDAHSSASVLYKPEMEFFDDGPTKPVRIWSRIGRRPILAAGNANGDIPMLQFTGTTSQPALRLLVRHDDHQREFDYTDGAAQALEHAETQKWTVVSIKRDWNAVFDERTNPAGSR